MTESSLIIDSHLQAETPRSAAAIGGDGSGWKNALSSGNLGLTQRLHLENLG